MANFQCNLDRQGSELTHVWSHTIGSDHACMALRADWQAQLRRAHAELGVRYVRFHGLLDDDMAVLLNEKDTLHYGFHNIDLIVDFLREIGMRPFVELSFMPSALASGDTTVFSYHGNVTPPKKMTDWDTLIARLVHHWIARYGLDEVRQWYFEIWNEPNIAAFWTGTQADYFELYRHSVSTIKNIDAQLRVGGPATANDEWIADFVAFCRREKLPCDFISTHHYPTDAFGKPGDDTEKQLSLATRGILRQRCQDTCAAAAGLPVYYTEWSSSSNPFFHRHDEAYAAAFMLKNFVDVTDLVHAYSYWTFSDIFEENYFSSLPFHGGFGLLNIHGIAKPTYRAFELLHRLGNERLLVDGCHATVDATIARGENQIMALLTNHAFPQHPIENEPVTLVFESQQAPVAAFVERIDSDHCNPRGVWENLGCPACLDANQLRGLHAASQLQRLPLNWQSRANGFSVQLDVPAHAVAAVTLEFANATTR